MYYDVCDASASDAAAEVVWLPPAVGWAGMDRFAAHSRSTCLSKVRFKGFERYLTREESPGRGAHAMRSVRPHACTVHVDGVVHVHVCVCVCV